VAQRDHRTGSDGKRVERAVGRISAVGRDKRRDWARTRPDSGHIAPRVRLRSSVRGTPAGGEVTIRQIFLSSVRGAPAARASAAAA